MRQSLRAESPQVDPGEVAIGKPLHPVLSTALANLDIQLEGELAHYRRQRSGTGGGRTGRQGRTANKSLDLIAVSATGGRTRPSDTASQITQPLEQSSRAGVAEDLNKPTIGDSAIAATSEQLPLAIAVRSEDPLAPANEQELATANQGQIVQPPNPDLDDYLESSEELLRSLAVEEAEIRSERGFMQSLLTPLGAGSMLLLLLSSAMFGYMVMNPFSLSRLTALGGKSNPSVATTGAQPAPASALPQPNLAAQEFKDLNLNTLGTLKAGAGAAAIGSPTVAAPGNASTSGSIGSLSTRSGAANPSTTATQTSSRSAPAASAQPSPAPVTAAAPRRAPVTYTPPARTYNPPARTYTPPVQSYSRPAPTRSAPASVPPVAPAPVSPAVSQTSPNSFPYKVVTPYEGDRALEQVRKVAPDAYVPNFPDGAKIQSGAYRNSAEAEARVEELRNQGISADVYKR